MRIAKGFAASIAAIFAANAAFAEAYTFVNGPDGTSYIKINEDLASFRIQGDFHSVGNAGTVGYYLIPEGLEGKALSDYAASVDTTDPKFGKRATDGVMDFGALKEGDRVGLYLVRRNGRIYGSWTYGVSGGRQYITFDKNGGHGRDERIYIGGISVEEAVPQPSGAPLPGVLAILAIGGVGAGLAKFHALGKVWRIGAQDGATV